MKFKLKKIWNNRIFRTFMQSFVSTIACTSFLGMDSKEVVAVFVSAGASALSAIMPLFSEGDGN